MSEHTAPPYEVSGPYVRLADTSKAIVAHVLTLHGAQDANAEFIVTACNAHDALHRALSLIAHGRHLSADGARGILDVLGLEVVAI